MHRRYTNSVAPTGAVLAALLMIAACGGADKSDPVAQTQTATPVQVVNQPVTISGCLRAGEATQTFVLTASQTSGAEQAETATYQLHLDPQAQSIDMQPHVGRMVEVSGVVRTEQEIANRAAAAPAGERATGTAGTPTVQTTTTVALKQLEVSSVKPLGAECEG